MLVDHCFAACQKIIAFYSAISFNVVVHCIIDEIPKSVQIANKIVRKKNIAKDRITAAITKTKEIANT